MRTVFSWFFSYGVFRVDGNERVINSFSSNQLLASWTSTKWPSCHPTSSHNLLLKKDLSLTLYLSWCYAIVDMDGGLRPRQNVLRYRASPVKFSEHLNRFQYQQESGVWKQPVFTQKSIRYYLKKLKISSGEADLARQKRSKFIHQLNWRVRENIDKPGNNVNY